MTTIQDLAEHMTAHASREHLQACLRVLDALQDGAPADCEAHATLLETAVALADALQDDVIR
ncbi:MAG: hypothetical protein Q4C89_09195 [Deinococcus sp.]|uniref:hypothetical protein n=1 Tax=Bacteria TaxID=2 RepID=UPI001EF16D56|nr:MULTISPECIES: hypothetical protein [Terrabacteria group]MCG7422629.1 hypothetical protein [Micrococcus sp. ACRRV]MDO4246185.1 hypothetical protein [Deinococcus sp.]